MNTRVQPRLSLLDVATVITTAVIAALALWVATEGPTGPIPMHFDVTGQPDRWGDRVEMAWLLGFMAFMVGAIGGGIGLAVHRSEDVQQRRGLKIGQFITLIAIGGVTPLMSVSMLRGAVGEPVQTAWVTAGMSLLLVVVGAVLGRVGPNPFVGVRTPWTFKSRLSWDRSNRLAGRLLFWLGLAGLVGAAVLPPEWGVPVMVGLILVVAVWTALESWRVWRDDPDRQPF